MPVALCSSTGPLPLLMQTKIGNTGLRLVTGEADQDTDAVVTAAHYRLNKGAGTDLRES